LVEIGYDGPVTPIAHPSQFQGRTRDKIVQHAAEGLNAMWEAAGLCPDESEEEEGGVSVTPTENAAPSKEAAPTEGAEEASAPAEAALEESVAGEPEA